MTESSHYAERYFPEHGIRYLAPGAILTPRKIT